MSQWGKWNAYHLIAHINREYISWSQAILEMTKQDQTITKMAVRSIITALQISRCENLCMWPSGMLFFQMGLVKIQEHVRWRHSICHRKVELQSNPSQPGSPWTHYPRNLLPRSPTQFLQKIRQAQADTEYLSLPHGYAYPILSRKGQTKQAVQNTAFTQGSYGG